MPKAKTNKLNAGIITQTRDKQFTKRKLTFLIDSKNYEVTVDEKLSVMKLMRMLLELAEKVKYMYDINQVMEIPNYMVYLIIKYFTDIDCAKVDSFEEQINVFSAMMDLDIIQPILDVIPEDEMKKIGEYSKRLTKNIEKFDKQVEDNPELMTEINKIIADVAELEVKQAERENKEN